MTPTESIAQSGKSALLVDLIRQVRLAKLRQHRERLRHRTTRDVLHAAIAMLADLNVQVDSLREQNGKLRDENRTLRDENRALRTRVA